MDNRQTNYPSVAVLMSTYNGGSFLHDQIQSIFQQNEVNVELIIRDDGSKDSTLNIINEFCNHSTNLNLFKGVNIGCKKSFFELARYASQNLTSCEYFAFSDQDDVWFPDKLSSAIKKLEALSEKSPNLYTCRTLLVDSELKPLFVKKSKTAFRGTVEEAVMFQPSPGCVMVFNKVLLDLYVKINIDEMLLHDDSLYKTCLICGGNVVYDDKEHMYYRQHSNNTIGGNQSSFRRYKRWLRMFFDSKCERSNAIKSLLLTHDNDIPLDIKKRIVCVVNYKKKYTERIKLLFSPRFVTGQLCINVIFKISVLFGRF
ncbi:glycosyltransferase [Bacteroides oleiciplenus]|uniref:Glycosyltransferase 2-like domain-containing protein n=1 Tax=Bacteroides oleiciplenus YIT 12058 TaxID=742727 RepID=K9E7U0_9BACE|nr:glycosyltransferase [Bacteroides oleiciplenus]EKU91881.1 hypothetical protein HMPREF9447_00867 [Bacteroides oleiciplenus YIT 12058]